MKKEKADGRLFLLITGISTFITSIIGMMGSYRMFSDPKKTLNEIKNSSLTPQYMLNEGNLYGMGAISMVPGLFRFIFSIFYIKWANEPEKAKPLKILIIVDLILSLATALFPVFCYGQTFSSALINIIGSFIFPILLFIGATKNENMLKD